MTVSSRAISPSCCASSSLRIANLCLEVRTSNNGSKARTAHGVYASSNRPNRLSNRLALGVLQRFAQLPAICDPRAGGMKRLERRFRSPRLRADAQREARTMDSPVVRVQVRIEDLQSGARFEDEPVDRDVVGQPAANRAEIGARQLPFHFASITMTVLFLCCGVDT